MVENFDGGMSSHFFLLIQFNIRYHDAYMGKHNVQAIWTKNMITNYAKPHRILIIMTLYYKNKAQFAM